MHTNATWKITVSSPENRTEDPQNCQKIRIKVSYRHFERFQNLTVAHNAFSCYDTISRGTVRRILKQYGVFSKNAAKKVKFEEEKQVFPFQMVYQYAQKAILFLAECGFLLIKRGYASPLTELIEFF